MVVGAPSAPRGPRVIPMRSAVLLVQCATYVTLGALLIAEGAWKLGMAQLLLSAVTFLVYS